MQRILEILLERHGLALWVEDRLLRLLKGGATVHMARGYADYVYTAPCIMDGPYLHGELSAISLQLSAFSYQPSAIGQKADR
jgi:hypothetical protein